MQQNKIININSVKSFLQRQEHYRFYRHIINQLQESDSQYPRLKFDMMDLLIMLCQQCKSLVVEMNSLNSRPDGMEVVDTLIHFLLLGDEGDWQQLMESSTLYKKHNILSVLPSTYRNVQENITIHFVWTNDPNPLIKLSWSVLTNKGGRQPIATFVIHQNSLHTNNSENIKLELPLI